MRIKVKKEGTLSAQESMGLRQAWPAESTTIPF
jgi:hypothetical protein